MFTIISAVGVWGAYLELRDGKHNSIDNFFIVAAGLLMANWTIQGIL